MDSVVSPITRHTNTAKKTVRANELSSLLDHYGSSIQVLSLDCFDTLLWRKTATPIDVFYDIQHRPTFKSLGFTARLRAQAEGSAREYMLLNRGISEVKLKDIYRAAFPALTEDELCTLENEELDGEINACYAFPPTVELIRRAHAQGLKIIIVSDTYLSKKQLKFLLENTLPADVYAMITDLFCSSEIGKSKCEGLFTRLFEQLKLNPSSVLHVGDNIQADYSSPLSLGANAAHLIQHDKHISALLRMQALACGFIDPLIRHTRPLHFPFAGLLATNTFSEDKPESTIGYASVGQIMYSFGRFIHNEIEAMKREGKHPKVVFLMRDAYLPSLVCETIAGKPIGKRVCISRFAATAASFRTKHDVDDYVAKTVLSFRFHDLCKQLLLPEDLTKELLNRVSVSEHPAVEFIKGVLRKEALEAIFKASTAYRQRLYHYLEKQVGLEAGDTLVFVDLGYTGTAQLKLEPIFREEKSIEIVGRYLLTLRIPQWERSRRGLLDASWCDDRILYMFIAYIALLEQICTSDDLSVIDYDNDGNPLYSDTSVSKQQNEKIKPIQEECLRFIRDAEAFFHTTKAPLSEQMLRDNALAELGRLLFFPSKAELNYMQSFKFDLNLGTKDLLDVFDADKGLMGLRRRGMFFMERNLKTMRTNYPAELRTAGIELVLTLMAQHRYEFDLRAADLSLRRESVNVIAIRGGQSSQHCIEALPTHDGYFSLIIPIGNNDFQIGVQFGLHYKWVQLDSADIIPFVSLYASNESENTIDASSQLAVDQMVDKGEGLYECLSDTGLMVFIPGAGQRSTHGNYVLRLVFRPLVHKEKIKQ
jgi:FMN phosphatase YigB (HAD superfamily)